MMQKTEEDLKKKLTPEQFKVMRKKGTEPPFTGKLLHNKEKGNYVCAACGNELFSSDTKFDSGTGWPSFYDVKSEENVELRSDTSHGMRRIEVVCRGCGSHLGHVFVDKTVRRADGPAPTGKRYCINSCALEFIK